MAVSCLSSAKPMLRTALACLVGAVWLAAQTPERTVQITMEGQPPIFRVTGSAFLTQLRSPNFPVIFQVRVKGQGEVPPVGGTYAMEGSSMVFRPRYPLEGGVTYEAVFTLSNEHGSATFTPEKPKPAPTTYVERVYPSAPDLPENQLKFYVHFSAPMSKGEAAKRIHLIDQASGEVKDPFLVLAEELWDRDFRRLTLLLDPGRIKRDLVPNKELGPPLLAGHKYTLVIDKEWVDANNVPMRDSFTKPFNVGPPDRKPLDPKTWRLTQSATAGSLTPVILDIPEPADAALLQRFIDVLNSAGKPVKGTVKIEREETRWIFTPEQPWVSGAYSLEVLSSLEDLAGNKVGRLFEVDNFDKVETAVATTVAIPFKVP